MSILLLTPFKVHGLHIEFRLSPSIHKFGNVFIYSGLSAE